MISTLHLMARGTCLCILSEGCALHWEGAVDLNQSTGTDNTRDVKCLGVHSQGFLGSLS